MPTYNFRQSLSASSTATPLAGTQYEFLPFPAFVEIGLLTDATGVLATVYSGSDLLQEEGPVQIGTINVMPTYPDHFYLTDEAAAGDRLQIKLRDTSAATRIVMGSIRITPLAG